MVHDRFFSQHPDEAVRLYQVYGVDWREIMKEMTASVAVVQRAIVGTHDAPPNRAFHGPDGRRRLECAVHEALTNPSTSSVNEIMEAMKRSGLGLSESEAEIAAVAAAAAAQLVASTAAESASGKHKFVQMQYDAGLLWKWRQGFEDVTVVVGKPNEAREAMRPRRPQPTNTMRGSTVQQSSVRRSTTSSKPERHDEGRSADRVPSATRSFPRVALRCDVEESDDDVMIFTSAGEEASDGARSEPELSNTEAEPTTVLDGGSSVGSQFTTGAIVASGGEADDRALTIGTDEATASSTADRKELIEGPSVVEPQQSTGTNCPAREEIVGRRNVFDAIPEWLSRSNSATVDAAVIEPLLTDGQQITETLENEAPAPMSTQPTKTGAGESSFAGTSAVGLRRSAASDSEGEGTEGDGIVLTVVAEDIESTSHQSAALRMVQCAAPPDGESTGDRAETFGSLSSTDQLCVVMDAAEGVRDGADVRATSTEIAGGAGPPSPPSSTREVGASAGVTPSVVSDEPASSAGTTTPAGRRILIVRRTSDDVATEVRSRRRWRPESSAPPKPDS